MGANNSDPLGIVRVLFAMGFPKLAKLLDIPFGNREAIEFFVQIIRYEDVVFNDLRKKYSIQKKYLEN